MVEVGLGSALRCKDLGDDLPPATQLWAQIGKLIQTYRDTTFVQLGDGATASLRMDK
jgi:hypothetical protein